MPHEVTLRPALRRLPLHFQQITSKFLLLFYHTKTQKHVQENFLYTKNPPVLPEDLYNRNRCLLVYGLFLLTNCLGQVGIFVFFRVISGVLKKVGTIVGFRFVSF